MTNAETAAPREPVIDVQNVSKWFGDVVAVNEPLRDVLHVDNWRECSRKQRGGHRDLKHKRQKRGKRRK